MVLLLNKRHATVTKFEEDKKQIASAHNQNHRGDRGSWTSKRETLST